MEGLPQPWDYLVVTASNDVQARAYQTQLAARRELGMLSQARYALVVADPGGRRAGSGGSTLGCLREIIAREGSLAGRRILIVHAGGDSRRLPAYGPCGKIFVPLPEESDSALGATLFDRLIAVLIDLPAAGADQIVIASGDALLLFDPASVSFAPAGITALGHYVGSEEASRHGVLCAAPDGALRLYLQKPSAREQERTGALDRYGRAVLDLGLMSFDAATASVLLKIFDGAALEREVDFYREVCCALGAEATLEHYVSAARGSGSAWDAAALAELFPALHAIPAQVRMVPRCTFLHFGATGQLAASASALAGHATDVWVEGCRLNAPVSLSGNNVLVGVDIDEPLALPPGACLDVLPGASRAGGQVFFVRCYGVADSFKDDRFLGRPLAEQFPGLPSGSLWDARLFPAEADPLGYRRWLWMFDPASATEEQMQAWRAADRYSAAEMAVLADQQAFHRRRAELRAEELRRSLRRLYGLECQFSAADLAYALEHSADRAGWVVELLAEARWHAGQNGGELEDFTFCRIVHSLGAALRRLGDDSLCEQVAGRLPPDLRNWMNERCLAMAPQRLADAAFRQLNLTILRSSMSLKERPRNALRPDETIWGRAPARIELGGGWTDTPPYTLEFGGEVINVAVNLNGQPPIHCYCRVVEQPVIRLSSIDVGRHIEIGSLEELLDYRRPGDGFALAKAALAISGFSPELAPWAPGTTLREMLEQFGGGIELTTLVGIPKGSGLGTSSILGAVLIAVLERMMGRVLSQRELFHNVLRLEQALTTGGGWQDQIGGGVPGVKITATQRGLFPDPRIHYVPDDVIDPRRNGGGTLLYYTGLTRLAKNILQQIVGGYFNRDRGIMAALAHEHLVARAIADALARKDAARCGYYLDAAWRLQKKLCGEVTNPAIESLLARLRPHVHGMRISGAGSGGFLFMICKSPADAAQVRDTLERQPLNDRARFFDFEINRTGLEVTTC